VSPRTRKSGDGGLYYDKKRDLWVGVFDNGTKPDGSRRQVRVTSRSQTEARNKMDAKKAEIKLTGSEPFLNRTVAEWGEYWLKEIQQPKMKPGPWRSYNSVWKTWILKPIGKMKVKDVRPSDLRRIYDNINRAGKSDATRLKAHVVMSSMFEAARLEGVTGVNVANNIKPPKVIRGDRAARSTFEPEVTLAILQEALNHRHPTKWIVSLYSGIRQGERLGATVDSVDLERGVFTVKWNLVEGNYEHGCGGTCGKAAAPSNSAGDGSPHPARAADAGAAEVRRAPILRHPALARSPPRAAPSRTGPATEPARPLMARGRWSPHDEPRRSGGVESAHQSGRRQR
jgi:integrase